MLLVLGLALSACAPSVDGELVSLGGELGSWTMRPDGCESGELTGFFGVLLTDEAHPELTARVFREASGQDVLQVVVPGSCNADTCLALEIDHGSGCATYRTTLERSNWQTNDVWHMDGELEVDCRFLDGGALTGRVTFSGCH